MLIQASVFMIIQASVFMLNFQLTYFSSNYLSYNSFKTLDVHNKCDMENTEEIHKYVSILRDTFIYILLLCFPCRANCERRVF